MNYRLLFIGMSAVTLAAAGQTVDTRVPAESRTQKEVQHRKLVESRKAIFFGEGSQTPSEARQDSLINIYYEDQFRHSQDSRAPYFLLMSRDANIAMGVFGTLQGNASYGFDGTIGGTDFAPMLISVPRDGSNVTRFQTSLAETAIGATVFGRSRRFGKFLITIEGKFSGPSNTFKLDKAFITIGKLTLGQHKSLFSDPSALPNTVETMGPSGAIDDSRWLLRFIQPFHNKWSVGASVEMPDDNMATLDGYTAKTSACAPNLSAYLQYGNSNNHVRVAGIAKSMRYRDMLNAKNRYITGWGVNLTTVCQPLPALTLFGGCNYGHGVGSMVLDLSNGVNDLLSYDSSSADAGHMYAPATLGWYAAVQYNFTPEVYSTVVFSQDRLYRHNGTADSASDFRYGMYAVANIFWEITPRMQVGAEFDWARRVNLSGEGGNAHRLGLMAAFNF